jgi:hypothetical protein
MLDNRRGHGVEMSGVEERRAVVQLHRAVTARSRAKSPARQEIDVALAGEVEAMVISADERARRSG